MSNNEYKINDWYSFFVEGETKTFYSFEKISTINLNSNDNLGRIIFKSIPRINIFEVNIISFMDIIGIIGGIYQILYIFSSLLLKGIYEYSFKNEIESKLKEREVRDNWFTYPNYYSQDYKKRLNKGKIIPGDEEEKLNNSMSNTVSKGSVQL